MSLSRIIIQIITKEFGTFQIFFLSLQCEIKTISFYHLKIDTSNKQQEHIYLNFGYEDGVLL